MPAEASEKLFRSTYRLQIQKDFTFQEAAKIVAYLDELGISHLYLSPILESRPGSNHGYDGIDPTKISEERGGEEGFQKLIKKVEKAKSIEGVILDIVPNHLASSWRNPAWWDVMKKGKESKYWDVFDIRARKDGDLKLVLPVLGRSRQAVIAARELQIAILDGALVLKYWDNFFPLSAESYGPILKSLSSVFEEPVKKSLQAMLSKAPSSLEKEFSKWWQSKPISEKAMTEAFQKLPIKVIEAAAEDQNYSLEEWRRGSREVNYRRFFDINDLAAVRIEDSKAFQWTHAKIEELTKKYPVIHGLRIDHIDGLTDPEGYLKRLQSISKKVWVEKILGEGEHVPKSWPLTGTTGYEFLGLSARCFVDLPGLLHLHSHYIRHVDRRWERFHECVYDSKREMLETHFVSEVNYLVEEFYRNAHQGSKAPDFSKDEFHETLVELTSSLRVYRSYFSSELGCADDTWLRKAFAEAEGRGKLESKAALNWLKDIMLEKKNWPENLFRAIKRWEQLTGPVMAKGLEDTALYRYFPLLSLNVVGGEPDWVGDGAIEFHAFNSDRQRLSPLTMNTTSTHDTKRSEDVRSRIHVISELAEEFTSNFEKWHRMNSKARYSNGRTIPEPAIEYLIYETLLGAWPLDNKITDEFLRRMKQYFTKALREGKSGTSWNEPDMHYENEVMSFVDRILRPKTAGGKKFLASFQAFAEKCAYFGALNSLSLTALKVFSPGVADFYQGCEMWDLSLVDPDNRRPVDFALRSRALKEIKQALKTRRPAFLRQLMARWKTGEIKLWLTWELLQFRQRNPELFVEGEYFSVEPVGPARRHFLCLARQWKDCWALVITPRFLASQENPKSWKKLEVRDREILATQFHLPAGAPRVWKNILTGEKFTSEQLQAGEVLAGLPVAVLVNVG